jgi:uncharacterized protein (DUF111 family)
MWSELEPWIAALDLEPAIRANVLAIFRHLAEAEARAHGVTPAEVHFHEVADWDSVVDIIAAASLAARSRVASWSVASLPLGAGTIAGAHGVLPIPAPATVQLLKGFYVHRDDEPGERVTPTGAAILRHLVRDPIAAPWTGCIVGHGAGAGTRKMRSRPNILRVLAIDTAHADSDQVGEVGFEIDDMTPEEISVALDRIRADDAVLDAAYHIDYGKKSRTRFAIRVLLRAGRDEHVADLCFRETATLGLRTGMAVRRILPRSDHHVAGLRVKRATRPGGTTAKTESDDLAGIEGLDARRANARIAESADD